MSIHPPEVEEAMRLFLIALVEAYPDTILDVLLFGSRARGDARPDSDVDLAIVMAGDVDAFAIKVKMADLAYDAIVATGIHVSPWPISVETWHEPDLHSNPALVRAMHRDGVKVPKP